MESIFFVKSATVKVEKFNIKDIPGSSGRLDVISRCILAALFGEEGIDKNFEIWVFLDKYGTFIFNSNDFNENYFPISEILLSDYFVKLILDKMNNKTSNSNPLRSIRYNHLDFFEELRAFEKRGYKIIVLDEDGEYYKEVLTNFDMNDKLLFVIGDQTGSIVNSKELKDMNLIRISFGLQSYLASSVIKLIKLNLQLLLS